MNPKYRLKFDIQNGVVVTSVDNPVRDNNLFHAVDISLEHWAEQNHYFGSYENVLTAVIRTVAGRDLGVTEWRGICSAADRLIRAMKRGTATDKDIMRLEKAVWFWNQANRNIGAMELMGYDFSVGFRIYLNGRYTVLQYWGGKWE